ncbi:unnamed protein product [Adineta steineri]|uniref:Uncharacterized protein n=1 Tax=Adineta steineri TaxID=433720 RepID=A0A814L5M7_9BILA|nr:unnamed protein product [Adineta steineri]CAF1059788.1 unnamed protein product [Adineta steineri]CAF1109168.1 unnamed protein product [Adineta steineri]
MYVTTKVEYGVPSYGQTIRGQPEIIVQVPWTQQFAQAYEQFVNGGYAANQQIGGGYGIGGQSFGGQSFGGQPFGGQSFGGGYGIGGGSSFGGQQIGGGYGIGAQRGSLGGYGGGFPQSGGYGGGFPQSGGYGGGFPQSGGYGGSFHQGGGLGGYGQQIQGTPIGFARKIRSLDNDKFNSIVENFVDNLKSFIHDDNTISDNNELSEQRQKVIDALDIISKSKESNSDSDEQENLDKQEIVSNYIDIDHHNVPENSEEN